MEKASRLIADMHSAGIYHRDLKASNILIRRDGEMVLADLDGAQIKSSLSRTQRVRDLARFLSSLVPLANAADRLFFIKSYTAAFGPKDDLKQLACDVAGREIEILSSKRLKNKYGPGHYRYIDAYLRRQRRLLARR